METSPPVRDVSERERANRNKCIIVAVISVLVLLAIVLVIAYITHFRSTDLTPDSAASLVDRSILALKNDSVTVCDGKYEILLRENGTALIERLGECREVRKVRDDDDTGTKSNGTEPVEELTNIICKLSASAVKILPAPESNVPAFTKDCRFNVTLEVDFVFKNDGENDDEDGKIGTVRFVAPQGLDPVPLGIAATVYTALGENVLELVRDGYSTANATIESQHLSPTWRTVCSRIPSEC